MNKDNFIWIDQCNNEWIIGDNEWMNKKIMKNRLSISLSQVKDKGMYVWIKIKKNSSPSRQNHQRLHEWGSGLTATQKKPLKNPHNCFFGGGWVSKEIKIIFFFIMCVFFSLVVYFSKYTASRANSSMFY